MVKVCYLDPAIEVALGMDEYVLQPVLEQEKET